MRRWQVIGVIVLAEAFLAGLLAAAAALVWGGATAYAQASGSWHGPVPKSSQADIDEVHHATGAAFATVFLGAFTIEILVTALVLRCIPPSANPSARSQPGHGVEIFVLAASSHRVLAWLRDRVGPLGPPSQRRNTVSWSTSVGTLSLTSGIDRGRFVSVWLDSPASPWPTDVDFARAAVAFADGPVRCAAAQPQTYSQFSDQFIEIDTRGERLVSWQRGRPSSR